MAGRMCSERKASQKAVPAEAVAGFRKSAHTCVVVRPEREEAPPLQEEMKDRMPGREMPRGGREEGGSRGEGWDAAMEGEQGELREQGEWRARSSESVGELALAKEQKGSVPQRIAGGCLDSENLSKKADKSSPSKTKAPQP